MPDLLDTPCPFCGGPAELVSSLERHWLECCDCRAIGPQKRSTEEAEKAWHTRHGGED